MEIEKVQSFLLQIREKDHTAPLGDILRVILSPLVVFPKQRPANKVVTETPNDFQTGARALGLQLHVLNASTEREIEDAFENLKQMRVGGQS